MFWVPSTLHVDSGKSKPELWSACNANSLKSETGWRQLQNSHLTKSLKSLNSSRGIFPHSASSTRLALYRYQHFWSHSSRGKFSIVPASSCSKMPGNSRTSRLSANLPSWIHLPNCSMKLGSCSRRSRSGFFFMNSSKCVNRLLPCIVERRTYPEVPPRVEYRLTEKGEALVPLIEQMRRYGRQWLLGGQQAREAA